MLVSFLNLSKGTVMNSISASMQKQTLRQLVVDLGTTISNKQRQTLIEIYIALDNASRSKAQPSEKLNSSATSVSGAHHDR